MVSTPSLPLPTPLAALGPTDALSVVKRVLDQVQSHARTLLLPSTVVGCVAILEGSTRAHADAWASRAHQPAMSELLSQVMLLNGRAEPQTTTHRWPQRLGELGADMDAYGSEALAAVLLALGANPWHDVSTENPVGTSLPVAMGQLQIGLCEAFWAVADGRPGLDALQACRPTDSRQAVRHWLDWAAEQPDGTPLVRWLLARGVRSGKGNHALSFASSTDVLQAFQEANDLPSKASDQKRVVTSWESRLSKGYLAAETINALKAAFSESTTFQAPEEDPQALSAIQEALSLSSWNQQGVGSLGYAPTVEQMNQRATVVRGTHAGTWSLLVARLFADLRPCWTHSMGRADLHRLVDGPILEAKTSYQPQKLDWAAMAGAMREARDFDWLPGISINGPLALVLLAYLEEDDSRGDLSHLSLALGIDDFWLFWRAHAFDAAAFSETLGSRLENANSRLCHLWGMALGKQSDLLKGNPEAALRVFRMRQQFHHHYESSERYDFSMEYRLEGKSYTHFGTTLHEHALAAMENHPLTVDWLVELALWEGPGQGPWALRIQEAAEARLLEKRHLDRMKAHIEASFKKDAREAKSNRYSNSQSNFKRTQEWADKMRKQVAAWALASRLASASATTTRTRL